MSTRFDFIPDRDNPTTLTSPTCDAEIVVANNGGIEGTSDVFIGIDMHWDSADPGEAWAAVDANELRDAIDKAVGEREGAKGSDPRPYRPIDRDRLLRHIGDIEATLARRNEQHEQDQARIRVRDEEIKSLEAQVEALVADAASKTAREYLELAWGTATVPEDGMIHEGEGYLFRFTDGGLRPGVATATHPAHHGMYRLLEPRVEPTEEERRQAIVDEHGLQDWEIELLAASGTN